LLLEVKMSNDTSHNGSNDSSTECGMQRNLFLGPEFTIVIGIVLFGTAELVKLVASLF
jgi:hypothetical protein